MRSHEDSVGTAGTIFVSQASDEELARRVQDGDSDAFETLARKYMRPVCAVVSAFLQSQEEIDDSVQETFLRALERIRTYNPSRPFAPWIYQVARNVARNRWKYLEHRRHEPIDEIERERVAIDQKDPSVLAELAELRHHVASAIDSLPGRQRTAFRLHDVDGFKASEIAEMLGINAGSVRANVYHARKALRERLQPYRIERNQL